MASTVPDCVWNELVVPLWSKSWQAHDTINARHSRGLQLIKYFFWSHYTVIPHIESRVPQILVVRSSRWSNFVQYIACFMSPFCLLEFWSGSYIFGKVYAPMIQHAVNKDMELLWWMNGCNRLRPMAIF